MGKCFVILMFLGLQNDVNNTIVFSFINVISIANSNVASDHQFQRLFTQLCLVWD